MTRAVIIAGGKGTRLRPLTYEIAKAMIPVHGRRLIDIPIDLFFEYQAYEIWLSLGEKANQIVEKYTFPYWLDRHTIDGRFIQLGTGGWLNRLAKSDFSKEWKEDFYVCNSDNLFDLELDEMMKLHKDNNFVVTIACTKVDDVREYGSVHIKNKKITSFEEKKKSRVKKSGWINGGYYIFSPEIFEYVRKLNININDPVSLEKDLFPLLAKEGKLGAFKSEKQWFDTGTFDRWDKVIKEWRGINGKKN